MRMSCNGCRVLRKGCSDSCSIRPCLQWIKSPEAQANATVFLAKFYGRAGLINLINAGPEHLRPAIFRSLLYEACGRIVNPIYGSVGLLWSGSWQLCQAAVESVLKGAPITQISSESAVAAGVPGHKPYDIRHVAKNAEAAASAGDLHRVAAKSRGRFKRSGSASAAPDAAVQGKLPISETDVEEFLPRGPSHDSDGESGYSMETPEGSHVSQGEPSARTERGADQAAAAEEVGMGLDLTLGLEPAAAAGGCGQGGERRPMTSDARRMDLGLSLTA